MLNFATKIFGTSNERQLKQLYKHVEPINVLEPKYEAMSDDELKSQTDVLRGRLDNGEDLDDLLHDAFAVVREASKRTLGLRPFDVQLVGGMTLNDCKIAEMKTGEGKTLVAVLPAYLNALSGKGVHIVTVNDYLAQRDASWMGAVFEFLGMSVGCIYNDLPHPERQKAYACDITYGTNNEFGFDYLRDNMKFRLDAMVQREFNFAIVDEVDSILIDEARTPLIISGPSESETELYNRVNTIIPDLNEDDFEKDEKMRTVTFTDEGNEHVEELLKEKAILSEGDLYDPQNINLIHHVNQALRAHKLFARDTDYIVKDGKVIIIDEFTGRMMEGRRFSDGLHQALEAKERVEIQNENQTLASITFQNYFRLYPKLAGMTGTAMTEAEEFAEIYNLGVVEIPTNVPVTRIDDDDKIYKSLDDKDNAIIRLIEKCNDREQPVLVGTVSIEKSEKLSAALKKAKIKHNVLNARHHEQESQIIAQAGRPGAVTIATNMAGRGTDIKLGGNVEMRIADEIGEDADPVKDKKAIEKIESEIAKDAEIVKEAGGLMVIGTERHESRRIDNQLRGRSGRQGDPGHTVFFLSVEDDLMRIFAADKMQALLQSQIGLKEGEALTHPWLSKALERAQARVEQQNFEVRKNLLKFDNVMNDQRKVIYDQRRDVMEADEELDELVDEMRHDTIIDIVENCIPRGSYAEQWDLDTMKSECQRLLALDLPVHDWAAEEGIGEAEMEERIIEASDKKMEAKVKTASPKIFRQLEKNFTLQILDAQWKEHLLNLDHLRQGINLRAFGQRDPLNEYKTEAFSMFEGMLNSIRETVTQTLSLVEVEADPRIVQAIQKQAEYDEAQAQGMETRQDPSLMGTGELSQQQLQEQPTKRQTPSFAPIRNAFDPNDPSTWAGNVGRNAPCPCGSGKKFKHCHGKVV
ncbi:MAG: preprotein translocase subunit SecA [Pseudomonadota bacterium]